MHNEAFYGNRPTIALLIPSLQIGGAERQLVELAKGIDRSRWNVVVITMYNDQSNILAQGIQDCVICLNKTGPLSCIVRLAGILRKHDIKILHAYLMTAQVYALMARLFFWKGKLVFAVRDALDPFRIKKMKDIIVNLLFLKGNRIVDTYIFNSQTGMRVKQIKKPASDQKVIFNGIDTERFKPVTEARLLSRRELGLPEAALLVGIVANISWYKDYPTFVKAARMIADQMDGVRFVSLGDDRSELGAHVKRMVTELALEDRFHFLGLRRDAEKIIPAMDIVCSSSVTEGFSNSICEAMACGVPCVVTDVGDSRFIVVDTGIVVPPSSPEKLFEGLLKILRLKAEQRIAMGIAARQRIMNEFTTVRMVKEHQEVYQALLKKE